MTEDVDATEHHAIFFSKQPILDSKRSIWGYELLGGEIRGGVYEVFPQRESSAGLSSSAYWSLQEAMERGKKIVVGLDAASIVTGVPRALPPATGVVRVLSGTVADSSLSSALRALRHDGYLVVADVAPDPNLPGDVGFDADILAFDFSLGGPTSATIEEARKIKTRLLARGVKTVEQFQTARERGFSLFQGAFFKEPEYVTNRQLSSNALSRLNLLRQWEQEDPDLQAVAQAISYDVAITFRLLTYLNSAHFALRYNVQTVDQAIMLLGWDKLKSWLRAVVLVDLAGKEEGGQEVAALSLQRGKFLELLATEYDYWGFQPGTLFLLGLFSLLDTILCIPMATVVEMLPFDAKLKAALRRDPDNDYWPLFQVLECLEDGDWERLEILSQRLCLDLGRVKVVFTTARDWAGAFFAKPAA